MWKLCHHLVLATCVNEEDSIERKLLGHSQHSSHYKSVGILQEVQGQLTQKSVVESSQMTNS